eukprot:1148054-Pelagomonas_calceolata.AAC.2
MAWRCSEDIQAPNKSVRWAKAINQCPQKLQPEPDLAHMPSMHGRHAQLVVQVLANGLALLKRHSCQLRLQAGSARAPSRHRRHAQHTAPVLAGDLTLFKVHTCTLELKNHMPCTSSAQGLHAQLGAQFVGLLDADVLLLFAAPVPVFIPVSVTVPPACNTAAGGVSAMHSRM